MATFYTSQLDPFALYGAGAIAGATSITLKSFQTIDGVNLAMSDFGSIGYGTLDPGNGTLEEQISFSGVSQNSNGSATLTGVKTVLFLSPYTESSGLAKTHAGSTPFVISNTSGFYNQFPAKVNDETITGQWTFTNTPIVPGTVSDASTTVKGVSKTSVAPASPSNPIVIGTNDPRVESYAIDTGTANAYAITLSSAPVAYAAGQKYSFKAIHANTTTSTLAVNGLSTQTIKLPNGDNLFPGAIVVGQVVNVEYDGTNFQMTSPYPTSNYQAFTTTGTWTKPNGLAGTEQVYVQIWGGGGGGGAGTSSHGGGGGGGGGYTEFRTLASVLGSTETVTVGVAVSAATVGNTSSFGSWASAFGGGPGKTPTASNDGGGGGGGGSFGAGITGADATGGVGGAPGGSAAETSNAGFGGGGGGSGSAAGGKSYGGGGGGGGASGGSTGQGGASIWGGGGGGAGNTSSTRTGGTSAIAGAGGAGGASGNAGADGTAPAGGGGGGGGSSSAGGGGARGEVRVWVMIP